MSWIRRVSTNWASMSGAVTSNSGSPAKQTVPSGKAHTSPLNLSSASMSKKLWSKRFSDAR